MGATTDQDMDSLLSCFDQIYEFLKSNCYTEIKKSIKLLKQDYATMIGELENQVSVLLLEKATSEATINQLRHDLAAHEPHMQNLANRLEQVLFDAESKYNNVEDCDLMVEYEEKNDLSKTDNDRNNSHSLLDAYEVERISKQLDNLALSSSKRFNEFDDQQKSSKLMKNKNEKKKKKLIRWRHSVVCCTREDVNSGALIVRTRPLP